jgi:hypothetical protein
VNELNRKVLVTAVFLMAVVMLATPLVASGKKTPTVAPFEVTFQTWPDLEYAANPPYRDYFTDEGDRVVKNLRCIGEPPLIEDLGSMTFADYPHGGINLTINVGTNDEYTLIGTVDRMVKKSIFYGFVPGPPSRVVAVGKWTFEITEVDEVGEENAPENAVGSTMSGWYTLDTTGAGEIYESTKGTGMFHRASMVVSLSITAIFVPAEDGPSVLFAHETGEGNMLFH